MCVYLRAKFGNFWHILPPPPPPPTSKRTAKKPTQIRVKVGTEKLPILSKILKNSMVTKSLALLLSHNIKQVTNLWHFWESVYEYAESVIRF